MINRLCLTFLVLSIDVIKQIVDTVIAATVEVITNTMMNRWFKTIYKKEQKILSLDRAVANGMLPVCFDVEPVKKSDKIHQEEKPIKLLEQILDFVTKKDEKTYENASLRVKRKLR